MNVLPACVSVHLAAAKPEEGAGVTESGITRGWEPSRISVRAPSALNHLPSYCLLLFKINIESSNFTVAFSFLRENCLYLVYEVLPPCKYTAWAPCAGGARGA